jgi:surface antigen
MSEPRPRTPVRILRTLMLAAIATLAASGLAHAQYRDVFGPIRPGPGDQTMMRERVQTLLDGPATPRTLEWRNSRTGNSGSVALMSEFTRRSQQCRQLEYRILPRANDLSQVAILVWCKQPNGRWAIVN